ncbi:AAA family ATPase [Vreelandella salicampi]|uniref:AAA family ATPase n=1 Tax=Vreelandella salicampi TaxID=1449798 RepID=A0A7Z0RUM7_9GAMM|nr:AAA family ATPase [Halomonas salicampi]NYS60698.1 AAA family ATPase [Halomonas salicampi]
MIGEIKINPPVATYSHPATLSDLRRINFIFGANGTGKTTISRVISQADGHNHCELVWQGGNPQEVMIYNRDFVDRNFNQDHPLQGVFTLGENQVDAEREIARLQPEIEKIDRKITNINLQLDGEDGQSGKRKELGDLELELRDRCWKQKQLHDDTFQEAFVGVRNKAESFKQRVLQEASSNDSELLSLDELKEKAHTVFSEGLERVPTLPTLTASTLVESESHELLQKAIIGNQDIDIAALIDRLGNSDWVKQGLKYHEQTPETCPFCQQPTDDHFSESLKSFFSKAYDDDIQTLTKLQTQYHRESEQLVAETRRIAEGNNLFLNTELFNAEAEAFSERLKRNCSLLEHKLAEPSRRVELEPITTLLEKLQEMVSAANEATTSHNQTVANIATEKQILTSQVWRFMVNELADDLSLYQQRKNEFSQAIPGMEESLRGWRQKRGELKEQIKELERQTTSIQPTIAAINDLLQRFGFHSFQLGESSDGRHYRIARENGEDASRSLSEGEKTFITFLYFYHLIKGAQTPSGITSNRVVVFDDPISSLDSDILYLVSSLIKGVMEEVRSEAGQIKQVFLLTHNVYFHKEITFNQKRPSDRALNEESFWFVKKLQYGSVVERCDENPVRSAYELLWEDVKFANLSSISLQNTLRRILENYFTMWGGMSKDEICALFDGRDKLICQSLFSWVNDGSHSIHDDLYIHHGDQRNEAYLRVFRDIFDKAGQLGHYEMMVGEQPALAEET